MTKPYNRIVLIGNGFDLAAGLDTSYKSFIDDYIKKAIVKLFTDRAFEDDLISMKLRTVNYKISLKDITKTVNEKESAGDALKSIKEVSSIKYKFDFFRNIIEKLTEARWVDIEQFYFDTLKTHYQLYSSNRRGSKDLTQIQNLNSCMDFISIELNKYLENQQNTNPITINNSPLGPVIKKCQSPLRSEVAKLINRHNRTSSPTNIIYLNFNYTNTINRLGQSKLTRQTIKHIPIHGSLTQSSNPTIFGYGDDTGEHYFQLEDEGENDLLRKIKSFQYPRTRNYHNLLNYLGGTDYDVFIIGHSCGLSDRTLLKTIFEHQNCLAIQNFHYKGEPEDFNKRMEISRHFTDKVLMRERVLPFDPHAIIPQSKK